MLSVSCRFTPVVKLHRSGQTFSIFLREIGLPCCIKQSGEEGEEVEAEKMYLGGRGLGYPHPAFIQICC